MLDDDGCVVIENLNYDENFKKSKHKNDCFTTIMIELEYKKKSRTTITFIKLLSKLLFIFILDEKGTKWVITTTYYDP